MAPRARPEAPLLHVADKSQVMELKDFRAWEEERLHTYGWVDEEQGIIRLPIEKAMRLTVERGLPSFREEPPPEVSVSIPMGAEVPKNE